MSRPDRLRRGASRLVVCALPVLAMAGCGSEADYKNDPRPPAPINVTAVVTERSITLSPSTFGGGPINLIVSNQTDASQDVAIEANAPETKGCGQPKETGPINPEGTATIKIDVCANEDYIVSVENDEIRSATVKVSAKRPSAQNDLLQP